MGSTRFQVSKVEMSLARPQILRSNHRDMYFAKYFPDRLVFYFFLACLETIRGISQLEPSWRMNNGAFLVIRTAEKLAFIDATVSPRI